MKGLDNVFYAMLLVISNVVAVFLFLAAIKWPHIARVAFGLLFGFACWKNWTEAHTNPVIYQDYATFTWSNTYKNFIEGWFARHTVIAVSSIAVCQGLIAISMLLKGWVFKAGAIGAIIFLLAILPLALGAGFPCTLIMALALYYLIRSHKNEYPWKKNHGYKSIAVAD